MNPLKFIGGFNATAALRTASTLEKQNIRSIIDYAREGSNTPEESLAYISHMNHLASIMSLSSNKLRQCRQCRQSLAIKLSSFAHLSEPENYIRDTIVTFKRKANVNTFMFDAEHTCAKDQEDEVYDRLLKAFHSSDIRIYKTVQAYRKDSLDEVKRMLVNFDRSPFAIKLVRGAYHSKSDTALFQTKADTDACYNECVSLLTLHNKNNIPVCFATHNRTSAELAIRNQSQIPFSFGQLLGMADTLTNEIRDKGFIVYKYVPYGTPQDMLPYLSRRLIENYPILHHC